VARTATMNGDDAKPLTTNTALTADLIQSFNPFVLGTLGTGGFTIGNDARVNVGGITYDWVALTAKAGEVFIGSYVGNNTDNRSITGVGFQPSGLMIFSDLNVAAVYSFASLVAVGGTGLQFNNVKGLTNCIQLFQADGFQVGTDTQCNGDKTTYHYVAWKTVAGKFVEGTYTGTRPTIETSASRRGSACRNGSSTPREHPRPFSEDGHDGADRRQGVQLPQPQLRHG
jgi:hypothetical protein